MSDGRIGVLKLNRPNKNDKEYSGKSNWLYFYVQDLEKYIDFLETDKDDYINYWGAVLHETKRDVEELEKKLDDAVGEICLMCGRYKQEHLGACNDCKWDE